MFEVVQYYLKVDDDMPNIWVELSRDTCNHIAKPILEENMRKRNQII